MSTRTTVEICYFEFVTSSATKLQNLSTASFSPRYLRFPNTKSVVWTNISMESPPTLIWCKEKAELEVEVEGGKKKNSHRVRLMRITACRHGHLLIQKFWFWIARIQPRSGFLLRSANFKFWFRWYHCVGIFGKRSAFHEWFAFLPCFLLLLLVCYYTLFHSKWKYKNLSSKLSK